MDGVQEQAECYRVRAKEVRTIAEGVTDPTIKEMLLGLASDYLSMAASLDRIIESNKLLKRT